MTTALQEIVDRYERYVDAMFPSQGHGAERRSLISRARAELAEARRTHECRDELLRLRPIVCDDDAASIDALLRREDERG